MRLRTPWLMAKKRLGVLIAVKATCNIDICSVFRYLRSRSYLFVSSVKHAQRRFSLPSGSGFSVSVIFLVNKQRMQNLSIRL